MPLGRRQSAPRYPRWLLFRYMLHGVMAYVPSSFSRILTQRNRRWRSVGSFSPHTLYRQRRQEPGSLSPSRRR
ncbi:hypothetical protein ECP03022934_1248 [Escherichia coli P0302293.4]|nr:hypothetical protein ECP03022934_1248 [Escherichia coli P0302293.4]